MSSTLKPEQFKEEKKSATSLLRQLGVDLSPRTTLLIYGLPMIGKTALALQLAKELGYPTKVLALELSWRKDKYRKFIKRFMPENAELVYIEKPADFWKAFYVSKPSTIIIDSLSVLADNIGARWLLRETDILPMVARAAPLMRAVAYVLSDVACRTNSIGIMIAQASGGPSKYRDLTMLRPSITQRVGHYCDYILLLEQVNTKRKLMVVAARNEPWIEGRTVEFTFTELK